jgi:hypothetical protein
MATHSSPNEVLEMTSLIGLLKMLDGRIGWSFTECKAYVRGLVTLLDVYEKLNSKQYTVEHVNRNYIWGSHFKASTNQVCDEVHNSTIGETSSQKKTLTANYIKTITDEWILKWENTIDGQVAGPDVMDKKLRPNIVKHQKFNMRNAIAHIVMIWNRILLSPKELRPVEWMFDTFFKEYVKGFLKYYLIQDPSAKKHLAGDWFLKDLTENDDLPSFCDENNGHLCANENPCNIFKEEGAPLCTCELNEDDKVRVTAFMTYWESMHTSNYTRAGVNPTLIEKKKAINMTRAINKNKRFMVARLLCVLQHMEIETMTCMINEWISLCKYNEIAIHFSNSDDIEKMTMLHTTVIKSYHKLTNKVSTENKQYEARFADGSKVKVHKTFEQPNEKFLTKETLLLFARNELAQRCRLECFEKLGRKLLRYNERNLQ